MCTHAKHIGPAYRSDSNSPTIHVPARALTIRQRTIRSGCESILQWGSSPGIVKTLAVWSDAAMYQTLIRPKLYKGYRLPPQIIHRCVWLYHTSSNDD